MPCAADVRFWHERKLLKGVPDSFEASFASFKRDVHHFPRDRHVIVVRMGGIDAIPIAYSLRAKRFFAVARSANGNRTSPT